MKWSVVPRETDRGDCYNCKSEGLLKFLGSVRIYCGRLITASQTGHHLPQFISFGNRLLYMTPIANQEFN